MEATKFICWSVQSSSMDWCNSSREPFYSCSWEHVTINAEKEMRKQFNNIVKSLKAEPYDSIITLTRSEHHWDKRSGISSFPENSVVAEEVRIEYNFNRNRIEDVLYLKGEHESNK